MVVLGRRGNVGAGSRIVIGSWAHASLAPGDAGQSHRMGAQTRRFVEKWFAWWIDAGGGERASALLDAAQTTWISLAEVVIGA